MYSIDLLIRLILDAPISLHRYFPLHIPVLPTYPGGSVVPVRIKENVHGSTPIPYRLITPFAFMATRISPCGSGFVTAHLVMLRAPSM